MLEASESKHEEKINYPPSRPPALIKKSRGKTVGAIKQKGNTLLLTRVMKRCAISRCKSKIRRGPNKYCHNCRYRQAVVDGDVIDIYKYCNPKGEKGKKYLVPTNLKQNQTCRIYIKDSWPNLVIVTKRVKITNGIIYDIYFIKEIIHTYGYHGDEVSYVTEKKLDMLTKQLYGIRTYEVKYHVRR